MKMIMDIRKPKQGKIIPYRSKDISETIYVRKLILWLTETSDTDTK